MRRYNVVTRGFDVFIQSAVAGGPLQSPWYGTFTQTNPATLAYQPWHNFVDPLDADGSGAVVPRDALIIINELNKHSVSDSRGELPNSREPSNYYYDVNGDGFVVPSDALRMINYLNHHPVTQLAGEQPSRAEPVTATPSRSPAAAAAQATASSDAVERALSPLISTVSQSVAATDRYFEVIAKPERRRPRQGFGSYL